MSKDAESFHILRLHYEDDPFVLSLLDELWRLRHPLSIEMAVGGSGKAVSFRLVFPDRVDLDADAFYGTRLTYEVEGRMEHAFAPAGRSPAEMMGATLDTAARRAELLDETRRMTRLKTTTEESWEAYRRYMESVKTASMPFIAFGEMTGKAEERGKKAAERTKKGS